MLRKHNREVLRYLTGYDMLFTKFQKPKGKSRFFIELEKCSRCILKEYNGIECIWKELLYSIRVCDKYDTEESYYPITYVTKAL